MKTKYAAQHLSHIYADLEQIGKLNDKIQIEALDAVYVRARTVELERLRLAVIQILRDGIEPLLERQAPRLEKRVVELEQRVEALEQQKLVPLQRRRAGGE